MLPEGVALLFTVRVYELLCGQFSYSQVCILHACIVCGIKSFYVEFSFEVRLALKLSLRYTTAMVPTCLSLF